MPEDVSNTTPLQYLHQIGLLLKAKQAGLIDAVSTYVIGLEKVGFRLAPSTRQDFLLLSGE
ncbi:MAG: DUF3368 domain-containing protein [Verrucomicrobia bacterium]|jgi:predicted nucleic acid-binding protein|nr:DUF3368 domain-containing protein [Verrucomicrobiota bacterium]|tara:strand:+ start:16711 stop:16893 length:183 start_codon:yes stop_codon:yes gene_type:complete